MAEGQLQPMTTNKRDTPAKFPSHIAPTIDYVDEGAQLRKLLMPYFTNSIPTTMECPNTVHIHGPTSTQEVISEECLVTMTMGITPASGTLTMLAINPAIPLPPKPPDSAQVVQKTTEGHAVNRLQPHDPTTFTQANKVLPLSQGKLAYQEIASIIIDNLENPSSTPFSAKLPRDALEWDGPQQLPEQQRRQPIKSLPQLDLE